MDHGLSIAIVGHSIAILRRWSRLAAVSSTRA
jgi:hypothetical protein